MASSLRPIKPLSLAGITPAADFGARPAIKWVAPTDLLVDSTYQRNLSERSMRLIRKTIENFNWNRFKLPIVVQVGTASLHVIDGQHTAIVAATLGIDQIPVEIVTADSVDARARAFVGHNSDRVPVSPLDIFRALVASGDPDALDVSNVCQRAGVRIRYISPSSAIAEGDTAAVGVIRQLVKRRGVIPARKTLQVLVKAKCAPIAAAQIIAAENIICVERPKVDLDELAAVVRIDGPEGLAKAHAKSKADRILFWRAVANRWLQRLDRASS